MCQCFSVLVVWSGTRIVMLTDVDYSVLLALNCVHLTFSMLSVSVTHSECVHFHELHAWQLDIIFQSGTYVTLFTNP